MTPPNTQNNTYEQSWGKRMPRFRRAMCRNYGTNGEDQGSVKVASGKFPGDDDDGYEGLYRQM